MSTLPIFVTIRDTRTKVSRAALSAIFCSILLSGLAFCANSNEPFAAGAVVPGDPAPRVATDRSGTLQTKDGLTLHLTTDLGLVRIIALEPGAPQVVRYTVHIETDARAPWAQNLLDRYALTAKTTASGVEMTGTLPPQSGHGEAIAQFWVQFTVYVPANFSVEVSTGAGDIETSDIGGHAVLSTQGGNIRTGRIGQLQSHLDPVVVRIVHDELAGPIEGVGAWLQRRGGCGIRYLFDAYDDVHGRPSLWNRAVPRHSAGGKALFRGPASRVQPLIAQTP